MPDGYLVQLGDGSLDPNDGIVDPLVTFTTDTALGSGQWIWSGTWNGQTFTNTSEPGDYFLATDGNVYFVPAFGPVDTITTATVQSAPSFTLANGPVDGTAGADIIDDSYTDADGDSIDTGLGGGPDGNDDTVNAGAGDDSVASGLGADQVQAGPGNDTVDAGDGDDLVIGGSGQDSILGGAGNDTLYGGNDPAQFAGTGGTNTLGTSFQVINLGNFADIDPDETNGVTENVADLLGSYGSLDAPLYENLLDMTTTDPNGSGNVDDNDNGNTPETVTIGGQSVTLDSVQVYNATLTYADGSTANITAVVFQTTTGDTFLAPELANNADSTALSAQPIVSISLNSISADNGSLAANRVDTDFKVPITDETGDFIDGGAGDDLIFGNEGDDTLIGGLGADTLYGGTGNDTFFLAEGDVAFGSDGDDLFVIGDLGEAGAGTINIVGGEGGETAGDTLQLNADVTPDAITFTNTDDAAGGLSGSFTLADGTLVSFSEIENIICFTPGARLLTPRGLRRVESLRRDDLVITRDNGPQPIRWIGRRTVPGIERFAPIRVAAHVLDGARAPLLVSPQHRFLFTGYKAELLFGCEEVLVAARHLVDGRDVRPVPQAAVTYIHVLFDRHEIIYADGAATESFHVGDIGLAAISDPARDELFSVFPELRSHPDTYGPTARPCLKRHEARLLQPVR